MQRRFGMFLYPNEPILGLILLRGVDRIIDEAESGRFPPSKVRPELEHKDGVRILHLVELPQLLLQLRLHRFHQIPQQQTRKTKLSA